MMDRCLYDTIFEMEKKKF